MLGGKFKGVDSNYFNLQVASIEKNLIINGENYGLMQSAKDAIQDVLLNNVFTFHHFLLQKNWDDKSKIVYYYLTGKVTSVCSLPKVTQGAGSSVEHQIRINGKKYGNVILSRNIETVICYSKEDQLIWKLGGDDLDQGDNEENILKIMTQKFLPFEGISQSLITNKDSL